MTTAMSNEPFSNDPADATTGSAEQTDPQSNNNSSSSTNGSSSNNSESQTISEHGSETESSSHSQDEKIFGAFGNAAQDEPLFDVRYPIGDSSTEEGTTDPEKIHGKSSGKIPLKKSKAEQLAAGDEEKYLDARGVPLKQLPLNMDDLNQTPLIVKDNAAENVFQGDRNIPPVIHVPKNKKPTGKKLVENLGQSTEVKQIGNQSNPRTGGDQTSTSSGNQAPHGQQNRWNAPTTGNACNRNPWTATARWTDNH